MYDNYNYPLGADGPNAPWNQKNPEEVSVDVTISQTLSRNTTLLVSDYEAEVWEDVDTDVDGPYKTGGIAYDFSNCDLPAAYEQQEYTIPQLLEYLKAYLTVDIAECPQNSGRKAKLQRLLQCCEGWETDETEIIIN